MSSREVHYVVYTDGASRKDGRGGWGASIRITGTSRQRDICGGTTGTTSQRMEMEAAIQALYAIDEWHMGRRQTIQIISDSKYLVDGATEYLEMWKLMRWRTAANKELKNLDLWRELDVLIQRHTIEWTWVKGHAGEPGNERADVLATMGVPA